MSDIANYHYVLQDSSGTALQYPFDLDEKAMQEILSKLVTTDGVKLHIYKRIKTIETSGQ